MSTAPADGCSKLPLRSVFEFGHDHKGADETFLDKEASVIQRVAEVNMQMYRIFGRERDTIGVSQVGDGRVLHYMCLPVAEKNLMSYEVV